jgi:4-aminobutyrate aminotransferase-like enzyme/Ser/Thr protein kinase RdoA (MazF antagonist)
MPLHIHNERPPVAELDETIAARIALEQWGIRGDVTPLPSYCDRNFKVDAGDAGCFVLRVANGREREAWLQLENDAMERVAAAGLSGIAHASKHGRTVETVLDSLGNEHLARMTTYMPGEMLRSRAGADASGWDSETTKDIGRTLARVDRALEGLAEPDESRRVRWDLAEATWIVGRSAPGVTPERQRLIERVQLQFLADAKRIESELPCTWIHGDGHLGNLVISPEPGPARITGVIDFGDMSHGPRIYDLAIAGAYLLGGEDPFVPLLDLLDGFEEEQPLTDAEKHALFPAICMRLAVSFTISTLDSLEDPDNEYVLQDQANVVRALEKMLRFTPAEAAARLTRSQVPERMSPDRIQDLRQRHMGRSLSVSYQDPLEIVRGRMQYLFDADGRAYLDGVNNVCHVGHCHPHVVAAAQAQIGELNTNTRYLHDSVARYAERLTALFPDPLSVAHFVNSGSEANELALRLVRAATGRRDMIVVGSGYHGNTSALVDLSDYKHAGPGGEGPPDWVHVVPCPDVIDGDEKDGKAFAAHVARAIESVRAQGREIAAMLVEPLIGCGGQIVPPPGYLREAFAHVRAAGGLCIADEVQVGFGRVGKHWWAFENDGVIPDVVTIGKPMGNGHPMAGVITTPPIAEAFAGGMEYFSTFGGNPVSAAIGMAVLDVIEQDDLLANAQAIGGHLLSRFQSMASQFPVIGHVRGIGLYLGVEFVRNRETREPAADVLAKVIESARGDGVLLSSDGPQRNVMKIKPPMCWTRADADYCLGVVLRALEEHTG